jgi:hypothetical protein
MPVESIDLEMEGRVRFMVPFSRNERYIRRSDTLERLGDKLVGEGHRRLALWGLGGVGYDPHTT